MSDSDQSAARVGQVTERSSGRTKGRSAPKPATARGSNGRSRVEKSSAEKSRERPAASTSAPVSGSTSAPAPVKKTVRRPRKAQLRLTQVDAWSVMKTSFLLSIAMGIVTVVAVAIVWTVLGAAGVFDSLNSTVQTVMGNNFQIQDYVGTGRVLGFTMLVAVVDVVLITAISTLGAFLYNLSATLLGGVEVTLTEDS